MPPHARPRAQRLHARRAGAWRRTRRRPRTARRAARRLAPSPRSSSSRWPARPACSSRRRAICKRLREICDKHGILLIFDEVITGFGRLGTPFAVDYFGVVPDIITTAKGITNGVVPMGAVFARKRDLRRLHERRPSTPIELFHGYTYSGNPLACAAGARHARHLSRRRACSTRAAELARLLGRRAALACKGLPHVIDIRNLGLIGGDRARADRRRSRPSAPSRPSSTAFEQGVLIRATGDIIALSPPLIIEKAQIDRSGRDARHVAEAARLSGSSTEHRIMDGRSPMLVGGNASAAVALGPHAGAVFNPATGEQIAELPLSTAAELDAAVAAAKAAVAGLGRHAAAEARARHVPLQGTPRATRRRHRPRHLRRARQDACRCARRSAARASRWSSSPAASRISSRASSRAMSARRSTAIPTASRSASSPASRRSTFPAMVPLWMYPVAIACGNTFILKPSETRSVRAAC